MRNLLFIYFLLFSIPSILIAQFADTETLNPITPSLNSIDSGDVDQDGDIDIVGISYGGNTLLLLKNMEGDLTNVEVIDQFSFYPSHVSLNDLDNDGDLDIVVVERTLIDLQWRNTIQWYGNDGGGHFGWKGIISEQCSLINTLSFFDFDSDGIQDIVSNCGTSLVWLKNDGQGNFDAPLHIRNIGDVDQILMEDIDNDGHLDLMYASAKDKSFTSLKKAANNEYSFLQSLTIEYNSIGYISLADFNKDGFLDLITVIDQNLYWLENNGNGRFEQSHLIMESEGWTVLSWAGVQDMDMDGDQDVIWITYGSVNWVENIDKGEFGQSFSVEASITDAVEPTRADFDNNGTTDLFVTNSSAYSELILLIPVEPTGGFGKEKLLSTYALNTEKSKSGDMDGDEDEDIVVLEQNKLVWYNNQGDGRFSPINRIHSDITDIQQMLDFEIGDINADGRMDIVSYNQSSTSIDAFLQQSDGSFEKTELAILPFTASKIRIHDLDKDGDLDILAESNDIIHLEQTDNLQFKEKTYLSASEYGFIKLIEIADVNQDEKMDLIVRGETDIWVFEQDTQGIFATQGSIVFPTTSPSPLPYILLAQDLNNDHLMDFIYYTSNGPDELGWWKNTGELNSEGEYLFEKYLIDEGNTVSSISAIKTLDVEGDGDLDILIVGKNNHSIAWYENVQNGNFGLQTMIKYLPEEVNNIFPIDIDGDKDTDIVALYNDEYYTWTVNGSIIAFRNLANQSKIHSTVFFDQNENGTWDEQEITFKNQELILSPNALINYSNIEGRSTFYVTPNDYELTYLPQPLWELSTNSSSYSIKVDENYEEQEYLFGCKPIRLLHRVEPYVSSALIRCNNTVPFWLNYVNTGTTLAKGTISLAVNDWAEFVEAIPPADYEEDGKFFWEITDMNPYEERRIELFYQIAGEEGIGNDIEAETEIQLVNEDQALVYTKNNSYASTIRCSYDPNDKLARTEHLGNSEFVWLQDSLYYTIRFQNTGNDTAFTVRIADYLDKKLDWATFRPITSSHDVQTNIDRNTGEITFLFEDILLPDSTTNEPESHGFVTYSIAPLSELGNKTEIKNTAFIYFDFNSAIITNTTTHLTTSSLATSITTHQPQLYLNIYPNPTKDFWQIEIKHPNAQSYQLQLLDVTGKKLQSYQHLQNGTTRIERKGLQSGIYFLQLQDEVGKVLGMGKLLVE